MDLITSLAGSLQKNSIVQHYSGAFKPARFGNERFDGVECDSNRWTVVGALFAERENRIIEVARD